MKQRKITGQQVLIRRLNGAIVLFFVTLYVFFFVYPKYPIYGHAFQQIRIKDFQS